MRSSLKESFTSLYDRSLGYSSDVGLFAQVYVCLQVLQPFSPVDEERAAVIMATVSIAAA